MLGRGWTEAVARAALAATFVTSAAGAVTCTALPMHQHGLMALA
jgi:hypothetical protein